MHITIAVPGRFHAFYLAERLLSEGIQCRLITSYPAFAVEKYGVPREAIASEEFVELLQRGYRLLPGFVRQRLNAEFFFAELFDWLSSKKIGATDICICWSGFSLRTLHKAKERGAKTILERGSSHIAYQQEIMKEECARYKMKFYGAHPKIVDKEISEYAFCDYIEVPSSFAKETFIKYGIPETKIIQGFRGVNLGEFRQIPKQDTVFRVIFSGAISLRKGVHYLLRAFKEAKLPGAELLLIGSVQDEMRGFLRQYNGSFTLDGHVPQDQLYRYYSQGSVFVMPSIEEGMAVVQLQAMACGLPLICTTNTGGADIIRDGREGFVVPIRDAEALKEKIVYLYDNTYERDRMGASAIERVAGDFTWGHYAKHMLNVYRKILASNA